MLGLMALMLNGLVTAVGINLLQSRSAVGLRPPLSGLIRYYADMTTFTTAPEHQAGFETPLKTCTTE